MIINSDASGNPVTETVQSVAVTDASGNPVTGIDLKLCGLEFKVPFYMQYNIDIKKFSQFSQQ